MSHAEPSVLIVDDERLNIDLMVDLLKPHYRTLVATNGEQALKRASGEPRPDILLLDVMMPEMDGYEVCRRLKADAATSHIPVIFVTAMSEVGDADHLLEHGPTLARATARPGDGATHLQRTQGYVRSLAVQAAHAPALPRRARRPGDRAALQVGAAPRHRQGRGARPHPAQAGKADP